MQQKIEHMKAMSKVTLFRTLNNQELNQLALHAHISELKKGDTLFKKGDPIDRVIVICKGRLKILQYDVDGIECILNIMHDEDVIYESLYFDHDEFPYDAICLTNVTLWEIDRNAFSEILNSNPKLQMSLISFLAKAVFDANEKYLIVSKKDPMIRLAGFLLEKDETCVGPEISMKLDDIAASIGLRPETISRNLKKLEKDGCITRVGHGKILVTDRTKLQEIYDS